MNRYKVLYWFYPLLFVLAYLQARAILPPYYYPNTGILSMPFRFAIYIIGLMAFAQYADRIKPLTFFILYNFLSIFCYFLNDLPIHLYFYALSAYVAPMLIAYIGYGDNKRPFVFYNFLIWSTLAMLVVGIYLYFIQPSWYVAAVSAHYNDAWYREIQQTDDTALMENTRMGSFLLISYAVGYLSMFSLPISLWKMTTEKTQKRRNLYVWTSVIIFVSAILCQLRVVIAFTVGTILLFVFLRHRKHFLPSLFITILAFVLLLYMVFSFRNIHVFDAIASRIEVMSFAQAMEGSRTEQVSNILNAWQNYIFGEGVGSGGGRARQFGFIGITDGNYVRLLYEHGVIGFILFIYAIFPSLLICIKNIRYLFIEFICILSILAAMVGADPLSYFFYIIPFWYVIGKVQNDSYLKKLIRGGKHL